VRIREPVVADRFYASLPERCRAELINLLRAAQADDAVGDSPIGGIVPHAGWTYSGPVTAKVFSSLAAKRSPEVIVLFGGVHQHRGREAALFGSGRWETPLGPAEIDDRLAERILGQTNLIVDDPYAHEEEHSIEVQVPFVRHLFPGARFVPIMVPPVKAAPEVGEAVARTLTAYRYDAVVVGTTDLTHYGPQYGFTPKGVGSAGNRWAKEENDRRFIDLLVKMRGSDLVREAVRQKNACSAGAAAATIAACAALGATRGTVLEHTSSSEVTYVREHQHSQDSVGYAGIVFS